MIRALFLAGAALAVPAMSAEITPDDLDHLPMAQVIFLGEVHDNARHHQHQSRAVAAIAPRALVFEMLTDTQAARVPTPLPDAEILAALLEWDASGWPDFGMYFPIFAAAPTAQVFGAAVPRETVRDVLAQDVSDVFGDDAARFGLTQALDPADQAAREAHQLAAHCDALPEHLLPRMVGIQRLRDATLAQAAERALAETGGPVVVITGTEHARLDWGAPAKLSRAAPEISVLALGQFEQSPQSEQSAQSAQNAGAALPFDLWLVTDPHPRPDPCEMFR